MKVTITNEIGDGGWLVDESNRGMYGQMATFKTATEAIEFTAQLLGFDFGRDPWTMDEKDTIDER